MQPAIPVPGPSLRNYPQPAEHVGLAPVPHIASSGTREPQQPARAAFREAELLPDDPGGLSPRGGRYSFFATTARNA
jgi:hypothetical protein